MPSFEDAFTSAKKWFQDVIEHPLRLTWNICSFLSVIIPLLLFFICRSRYEIQDDQKYDEQSLGAIVFCYLWTLVVFFVVVYSGDKYIGNPQEHSSFVVMLAMFANLAFVAWILSASNLSALDGKEWDGRWFSLFPSLMILTYALWTLISVVFMIMLYVSMKKGKEEEGENKMYYKDEDDAVMVESGGGKNQPVVI